MSSENKQILKYWSIFMIVLGALWWAARLSARVDVLAEEQIQQKDTIEKQLDEIKLLVRDTNVKLREIEKCVIWRKQ